MTWTRPENVPYPNVWARFEGKVLIDGKPLKYKIQDITEDLYDPILEHMFRYFLIREALMSSVGVVDDEVSVKELRDLWRKKLGQKMGLVAIVEGEGDITKRIAGCNIVYVTTKGDPKRQFQGEKLDKVVRCIADFYSKEDLFEKYGADRYLNALGLSVAPQYQGDGVGYHLLEARTPLCQATGIPFTVTIFSNPAAAHEALKAGFHKTQEIAMDKYILDDKVCFPRLKSALVLTAKVIPKAK